MNPRTMQQPTSLGKELQRSPRAFKAHKPHQQSIMDGCGFSNCTNQYQRLQRSFSASNQLHGCPCRNT